MADRTALGFIGYLYGAITAIVMLVAITVVALNVSDQANAGDPAPELSLSH
jgi:hypothetical protein